MTTAGDANRRGVGHLLTGELDAAAACFLAALAVDPDDASAWHNLSLVHKRRRAWADVLHCAERAGDAAKGRNEGAWWNAGLAATALHDWARARAAWRRFGFELEEGDGPVSIPMGPVALAVPAGPPVLAVRVDPARARVIDVPRPSTGLAHADLVLCDGEPQGEIASPDGTGTVRVVAVLERWRASGIPTVVAAIECVAPADRDALLALSTARGIAATDWADAQHGWVPGRSLGFAGEPSTVHAVLDEWRALSRATRVVHDADVAERVVAAP